jgi:hypothetical protein
LRVTADSENFNGFEGTVCDVAKVALAVCLLVFATDFLAVGRRVFEGCAFADVFDRARGAFPDDGPAGFLAAFFGDFLRVFLDIRLPFVAFGGSIMGIFAGLVREPRIGSAAGQG